MKKLGISISRNKIKKIKEICRESKIFDEVNYKILNCVGFVFKDQSHILLFIDGGVFFWAVNIKNENAKLFLETSEVLSFLNDDNKNIILYNLDLFT